MYPFTNPTTPATKTHMEAQLSFFNDMSKSLFNSVQQMAELNIQLAHSVLEESVATSKEILTAQKPGELLNVAAAHAQPASEKFRAYQQHVSRIAADVQVDLAKVSEEHVSETSRTAKALAEEVSRMTTEETDKHIHQQQEVLKKFSDPFERFADKGRNRSTSGSEMRGSSSLQSAGEEGNQSSNMQGNPPQSGSTTSQSSKQGSNVRKE